MKYKVIGVDAYGNVVDDDDEIYDTKLEAEIRANESTDGWATGADVLEEAGRNFDPEPRYYKVVPIDDGE